ncbi:hypothetical protein ACIO93_02195 [Streptomyces sp. NPDC087903]|uniref:hypothetical protein n=1 Tax=Streptomyces sp. NPDC087903 TaxID=3365819 RepID=UPI0037F10645
MLAHLEEQEREIAAQAETTRGRIAELTAQLEEFDRLAEEVRITRKTLLALPDPSSPTPPAAKLPDHPAYQQNMVVFAAADRPAADTGGLRGDGPGDRAQQRQQRPAETQAAGRTRDPDRVRAGVVHSATAIATRRGHHQPDSPRCKRETGSTSLTAL